MKRRTTAIVALTLGPALALGLRGELLAANPPLRGGSDVEDHHHLPPEYANFDGPVPVGTGAAEYPLAVDFVPAHGSNFTSGGITSVQYVVVHTIQGSYAGAISWFQNPSSNVSAHFMVRSGDGEVTQMVELADRAWHVGGSNPVSIGIEHEGWVDQPAYYTWSMYGASARLARWIADTHGLPLDRDHIVGHVELPNQTHTDPGVHWNWPRYLGLVRDLVGEGQVEAILVDASAPCELHATGDTWLKATAEPSAELDDTRRCALSSGEAISYYWASEEPVDGHHRVVFADPGPCGGILDPEGGAYLFAAHWEPLCDPTQLAAVDGVAVDIGDATGLIPDPSGRVVASQLPPGELGVEVVTDGIHYQGDWVPLSLDPFPGTRVIVPLDPVPTGDGDGDGDGDGGGDGGGDSGDGSDDGHGSDTGDGIGPDPDLPGDDADFDAEVEGLGGCAVDRAPARGGAISLACLLLMGLGGRGRPRIKMRTRRRSRAADRRI